MEGEYVYYIIHFKGQTNIYRLSNRQILNERTESVRDYVHNLIRVDRFGEKRDIDEWKLREIQALLGLPTDEPEDDTRQWWNENRADYVPTDENIEAFKKVQLILVEHVKELERRREQGRFTVRTTPRGDDEEASLDKESERKQEDFLRGYGFFVSILYHDKIEQLLTEWAPHRRIRNNFIVESIFFPLFIFFAGYVIPLLNRGFKRLKFPNCIKYALLAIFLSTAFTMPYLLGYYPSISISQDIFDGTILYGSIWFMVYMFPLFFVGGVIYIVISTLLMAVNFLLAPLSMAFNFISTLPYNLPPILYRFNTHFPSSGPIRGSNLEQCVISGIIFGLIALIVSLLARGKRKAYEKTDN